MVLVESLMGRSDYNDFLDYPDIGEGLAKFQSSSLAKFIIRDQHLGACFYLP
jgi:hypothetical protein